MRTISPWIGFVAALGLGCGVISACSNDAETDADDTQDAGTDGSTLKKLACKVAIVGGGAGGLHTAFRLAPELGDGVCLFEKEQELGGRIHDVALDENDPDAPRIGTGARRIMESQQVLFDLADELGLTLESPANTADLISARGLFGFAKDELLPAYPAITPQTDPTTDEETWLYDQLRFGPSRKDVTKYADFRAYVQSSVGAEEYHFLRDMSRFRADFEYPLDARGYMDYLDEEWDVCCAPSYPVGGMSAFIRGMAERSKKDEARVFLGEPVSEVSRAGKAYHLTTSKYDVSADKVVLAVPPVAFEYISGDVIDDIKKQREFQDIIAVRVVTITQWWQERWWDAIKNPAAEENAQVWRAWTTEHCLNFIEIPLNAYAVEQNVTRSVYDDDLNCVQFWEDIAKNGNEAVEQEIQRGLELLFNENGKSTPASLEIPTPLKTHVQVWPAAWHWLRAGTSFTNADVFAWAVEPLAGEAVGLVGEAFNPQRSGWSDGAYKSSINLLNKKYGMDLPGLARTARRGAARSARQVRGH